MILRLTPAQASALECACLDEDTPATLGAWRGPTLHVEAAHVEALAAELVDLANSEDAQAEECSRLRGGERDVEGARAARGARDALSNLAAMVGALFLDADSIVILAGCGVVEK